MPHVLKQAVNSDDLRTLLAIDSGSTWPGEVLRQGLLQPPLTVTDSPLTAAFMSRRCGADGCKLWAPGNRAISW